MGQRWRTFHAIFTTIRQWSERQSNQPAVNLKRFITGGYVFFAGMMGLILADRFISPSLQQEALALFCLLVVALGCLMALYGYLGLSLARILRYFFDD